MTLPPGGAADGPAQAAASRDAVVIRTPEGIAFSLPLAGPASRFLAFAVDFGCIGAASSIVVIALRAALGFSLDLAEALAALVPFVLSIGYGLALEWVWRGQTVGKRLLGLRVMDEEGQRLQPAQVVIRNLLRAVDALPALYLVGGIAMLANRRWQRLGDVAACTIVIRVPRAFEPDLRAIAGDKYNSLRGHPRLEARLRQRVSPDEAAIAVGALIRRDEFDPGARVALFRRLATRFKEAGEIGPELSDAVPDEQMIRNVLDVVLRRHSPPVGDLEHL